MAEKGLQCDHAPCRQGYLLLLNLCFSVAFWKMHAPSDFTKCCKDSGILMVVKCRKENSALKECLTAYYNDPAFYEECKREYLKEREEFRKSGIPTKKRLQKLPTSM
ncbi:COX assembly mitochondrial protein homolog isoform X2 [Tupaia chinensis]|uniref:COX assembly mitochondrial protein homolog isoform X2 n=1 Tax=Tupaia chinensis TaxID=246437 RepID=UPI000FFB214A|nr:COX assembly mitochondrial protein homolog isoform X2 [Tupaia chinensis]